MEFRQLTTPADLEAYRSWLTSQPQANVWQSLEWKQCQEAAGRETRLYAGFEQGKILTAALIIIDRGWRGLSTWDIGRGPLQANATFVDFLINEAKKSNALCVYASPVTSGKLDGFKPSGRHVYPEATRLIDIAQPLETVLSLMHPKGRYNIRVAEKHGVRVQESQDIQTYYDLAVTTAKRDGFQPPSKKQFQAFLQGLPGSFLLLAYPADTNDSRPIAGLLGVCWQQQGIYYYGASDYEHRALMAPYLLQWYAMQHCKAQGCTSYDLLGIAPLGADATHPWSGISGFKEKFGGNIVPYPPEQMALLRPWVYSVLALKRRLIG